MLHRINKLQFEALCATEAKAFEVRNNFSGIYQGQITDVIDKVCSRYVSEDEWIQIDRVEVNLGNFDSGSFEKIFTDVLLAKFENELLKKISSIPAAEKQSSKQSFYLEILVHFLQTGTVPWWAEDEALDIHTVFTEVAEQQEQLLYKFLEQHRLTPTIWQRLSMQFNYEVHDHIISLFPTLAIAEKQLVLWDELVSTQFKNFTDGINFDLPQATQRKKFILYHAPKFYTIKKGNTVTEKLIRLYAKEFTRINSAVISGEEVAQKIIAYENSNTTKPAIGLPDMAGNEIREEALQEVSPEVILPDKFTVHIAGAVLLAPYFKQLFTHLNLLEQGEWKSSEANYKAIHLIRYLVTGQQMCPEHSLVLEKLLCGIEINAPIPREVELSNEEMSEATELLQSVISNWAKLKNTSVEGLRETFLKRDGILTKKENGWLLQVERKTADVLLDSIPWGYTTLAFTWNNYIIFTEW